MNNNNNSNKSKAPLVIIIAIFFIIFAIFRLLFSAGSFIFYNSKSHISEIINENKKNDTKVFDKDVELVKEIIINKDELKNIELDLVVTDVFIVKNNDSDNVIVKWYSDFDKNKQKTTLNFTSGKLVAEEKQLPKMNFGTETSAITIYVPEDIIELDSFDIDSVSGDFYSEEVESLIIDKFEYKSVSGEIDTSKLGVEHLDVKTVSGDVSIVDDKLIEVSATTVSGDIDVTGINIEKIEAKSTSGDLNFVLDNGLGYRVEHSTISGEIDIREGIIDDTSSRRIKLSTVSGDIILK